MSKDKYIKNVKLYYYLAAIYLLLCFIINICTIVFFLNNNYNNSAILICIISGFLSFTSLALITFTYKVDQIKYNYNLNKNQKSIIHLKIRNSFALIIMGLFVNLLIFIAFLLFGILKITDYPLWLHDIILFTTFISFSIFILYISVKSWKY